MSPQERVGETGGSDPMSFDTGEMRIVTGGDPETGVDYSHYRDSGSSATSEHVGIDPVPDDCQFPSQDFYFGD